MINLTLTAGEAGAVLAFLNCSRKGHSPKACPACRMAAEAAAARGMA